MNNQKITPQTLKGFRDFLPKEAINRQYLISKIKAVFERFGFDPLETPALEYAEILLGKYGDEADKLLYLFEDRGKRKVGLRYDQTVPLARVIAQYNNQITFPFKRYQIQPVWRAENTQKGRYREFLQCDVDIIGSNSVNSDVEIIAVADTILKELGFKKYSIKFNSREVLFEKISQAGVPDNLIVLVIRIIDKIKKIGWANAKKELTDINGLSEKNVSSLSDLFSLWETVQPIEGKNMQKIWNLCNKRDVRLTWDLTLARGLDYYTGLIFEIEIDDYLGGSICGGGRYDKLIGKFINQEYPAVGFAIGFDRLIDAMQQFNLLPKKNTSTKVLVTVFSEDLLEKSLIITTKLRNNSINADIIDDFKLDKQLKYANKKGIPYVVIIGPEETSKNVVKLKNMKTGEQKTLTIEELVKQLSIKT